MSRRAPNRLMNRRLFLSSILNLLAISFILGGMSQARGATSIKCLK